VQIPVELLQKLLDEAYALAVEVHYNDVPAYDSELPLLTVLRQLKQLGIEPANYGFLQDRELLLD
jgi:hypothetical protein